MPEQIEPGKEMASSEPELWSAATNGQAEEVRRLLAGGAHTEDNDAVSSEHDRDADYVDADFSGDESGYDSEDSSGDDSGGVAAREAAAPTPSMDAPPSAPPALGKKAPTLRSILRENLLQKAKTSTDTCNERTFDEILYSRREESRKLAADRTMLGKGADMLALNRAGQTPADLASAPMERSFAAALTEEARRRAAPQPGKTFPGPLLTG